MRELLFKGKRLDNGEWVSGFPYPSMGLDAEKWFIAEIQGIAGALYSNTYEVDPDTIGQFTGQTDRNGIMIFEWDIVQFKVVHNFETIEEAKNMDDFRIKEEVVQFVDGEFTPRNYFDLCDDGWYSWGETDFAVIGNIHDRKSSIQSREG